MEGDKNISLNAVVANSLEIKICQFEFKLQCVKRQKKIIVRDAFRFADIHRYNGKGHFGRGTQLFDKMCIILDITTYCARRDDPLYFEIHEEEKRFSMPKMTRSDKIKLYNFYLEKLDILKKDIESYRPQKLVGASKNSSSMWSKKLEDMLYQFAYGKDPDYK